MPDDLKHLTDDECRQYACADFLDDSIAPDNARYLLRTINALRGKLLTAERDAVRAAVEKCCELVCAGCERMPRCCVKLLSKQWVHEDERYTWGCSADSIRAAFADVLEGRA